MKWATATYSAYAAVAAGATVSAILQVSCADAAVGTVSFSRHVPSADAAVVAVRQGARPVDHEDDHEDDHEVIFHAEGWTVPYASLLGLTPADVTPMQPGPLSLVGHRHARGSAPTDIRNTADSVSLGTSDRRIPMKGRQPPIPSATTHSHLWLHYITVAIFIKALCILCNIGMAIAPMSTVNKIKQAEETGTMDSLPYITIMCTGTQWCCYGIFAWAYTGNKSFLIVLYANFLGAVLGTYYAFIFQKYCRSEESWRTMIWYCKIVGSLFLSQFIVLLCIPMERGLLYCGCVAAFLSVLVTISPLSTIRDIYRTESVRSMPVELCVVSYWSSFVWLLCGFMLHDWWILLPNMFGIVVGTYTTYLIFKFGTFFQTMFSPKLGFWYVHCAASSGEPLGARRSETETTHLRAGLQPQVLEYGCNSAFSGSRLDVDDGGTGGTR